MTSEPDDPITDFLNEHIEPMRQREAQRVKNVLRKRAAYAKKIQGTTNDTRTELLRRCEDADRENGNTP